MRKLGIVMLVMIGVFSMYAVPTQASSASHNVTFTARFDATNLGTPIELGDQAFASRLSFAKNVEAIEDYTFAFWIVNGVVRFDLPLHHDFVVNRDLEIEAVFSSTSEHAVIFMDANGKQLDVQYVLDGESAVDVTENLPTKPNYKISETNKWCGEINQILEDTVRVLQYEIDTEATFTLTVVGEAETTDYLYNTVVTLEADPTGGQAFHYWMRDGVIVSYDETYRFTMMSDTTVEAVYGALPVVPEPVMYLSEGLTLRDGYVSYVVQFYLPEGYELIDFGLLTVEGVYIGFEHDTALLEDPKVNVIDKFYGPTNEFLMTFEIEEHLSARGYMVVETVSNLEIVYSTVTETYKVEIDTGFLPGMGTMTVKDGQGGFVDEYTLYFAGEFFDSTTDGSMSVPDEFKNTDMSLFVIKIDGTYYPMEVE